MCIYKIGRPFIKQYLLNVISHGKENERGLLFDFQCFITIKGDYSENMKRLHKNNKKSTNKY